MVTTPRKPPRQVDRSSPAWLMTYADMATLLLAFFIFLFSMAVVPEARFKAAVGSLQHNLGLRPRRASVVEPLRPVEGERRRDRQSEVLGAPGDTARVFSIQEGTRVLVGGAVLFGEGETRLAPEARAELLVLADSMRGSPNRIEIRGHASRGESDKTEHADDLELSMARAAEVARLFADEAGIRRARLRAAGSGSEEPATLALGMRRDGDDRRVEVLVLRETATFEGF